MNGVDLPHGVDVLNQGGHLVGLAERDGNVVQFNVEENLEVLLFLGLRP